MKLREISSQHAFFLSKYVLKLRVDLVICGKALRKYLLWFDRGHLNCVTFLVTFGVNLYSVDIDGHSAQELAAMNDQIQVLSFLDSAAAHLESSDTKKALRYFHFIQRPFYKW